MFVIDSLLPQVEVVSGTIVMRWVNTQLSQLTEWVDRAVQQEVCHSLFYENLREVGM